MKSIILSLVFIAGTLVGSAQIQSVTLQAAGLTCSMCSRAVYKSLKKLTTVSDVNEDIAHSSYHIRLRNVDGKTLSSLKKAVTDAGFSVARMELGIAFSQQAVANDSAVSIGAMTFRFSHIAPQTLNGPQRILILDKDYLLEKDRKKFAKPETEEKTGPAAYQVTLIQS